RALGLFVALRLAELQVDAERAFAERDRQAGFRIAAEHLWIGQVDSVVFLAARHRQGPRIAALGIVRAADEAAVAPETQAEPAGPAGGAGARVVAGVLRIDRKEVRPEVAVERV